MLRSQGERAWWAAPQIESVSSGTIPVEMVQGFAQEFILSLVENLAARRRGAGAEVELIIDSGAEAKLLFPIPTDHPVQLGESGGRRHPRGVLVTQGGDTIGGEAASAAPADAQDARGVGAASPAPPGHLSRWATKSAAWLSQKRI